MILRCKEGQARDVALDATKQKGVRFVNKGTLEIVLLFNSILVTTHKFTLANRGVQHFIPHSHPFLTVP